MQHTYFVIVYTVMTYVNDFLFVIYYNYLFRIPPGTSENSIYVFTFDNFPECKFFQAAS